LLGWKCSFLPLYHPDRITIYLIVYNHFRYIAVCHPFIVGKDRGLNHATSLRPGYQIRHPDRYVNTASFYVFYHNPIVVILSRNHMNGTVSNINSSIIRKRTFYYMVPAISVAIMINVPKFMEFRSIVK